MKSPKKRDDEKVWNIPNSLTLLRVVITFVVMYMIFADFSVILIVILFSIGMITDFLDGQIARRFKQTTEFGRKFDMIADRFLFIGTLIAIIVDFSIQGILGKYYMLQIFMLMAREVLSLPMALIVLTAGKGIPKARNIGKLTTVLQGVAFPAVLLGIYYPVFGFSIYLAGLTAVVGAISAVYYIHDAFKLGRQK